MCEILQKEVKGEGGNVQWSKVESCLFCLKAILYDIPVTEVTIVPQIVTLALGMPDLLGLKHTIMSLYGAYILSLTDSVTHSLVHRIRLAI